MTGFLSYQFNQKTWRKMSKRSVHFTTESPQIIQENSVKKASMVPSISKNMGGFSSGWRSRLIMIGKLFAIYAIPVVILLTQCGTFLYREIKTRRLAVATREGIITTIDLGQKRDRILFLTEDACASMNLTQSSSEADLKDTFKITVRDALLGADEEGELWKYFIMYEILIRASKIIDRQLCLTSSAIELDNITEKDKYLFEENQNSIRILLQLGSQRVDPTSQKNSTFMAAVQKFSQLLDDCNVLINQTDSAAVQSNTVDPNGKLIQPKVRLLNISTDLRNLEDWIESDVGTTLLDKLNIQFYRVESYYQFGIGILVASAVVCPLLAFLYIRSMNTMSTLIRGYAAHMVVKSAEVTYEKKHTERILHQMLPPSVADALMQQKQQQPETYEAVTIFFSDIDGFGDLVEECKPLQIVDWLNSIYYVIDNEIEKVDAYKVETIGDAYMVVSGLPKRNGDRHAGELGSFSLQLMHLVPFQASELAEYPKKAIPLRVGLHSGPCVAGVIGMKMPRYCLFGDTVNTASRMKSYGEALRIHISNSTKEVLDRLDGYSCISRGEIEVKGKGRMITWWLNGKLGNDFNAELSRNQFLHVDNE